MKTVAKVLAAAATLALGCSAPPSPASPETGTLWGFVRLVRRPGVKPVKKDDPVYGDRRIGEVEMVDYSKPGFAVIWIEGGPPSKDSIVLDLRRSHRGAVEFAPAYGAVGAGGTLVLKNSDTLRHSFSCPQTDRIASLGPGELLEIPTVADDLLQIFVLDAPETEATVRVVSGPHAIAGENGRWEIAGLPPMRGKLRAWHPRFPADSYDVEIVPGKVSRIDVEFGVANLKDKR